MNRFTFGLIFIFAVSTASPGAGAGSPRYVLLDTNGIQVGTVVGLSGSADSGWSEYGPDDEGGAVLTEIPIHGQYYVFRVWLNNQMSSRGLIELYYLSEGCVGQPWSGVQALRYPDTYIHYGGDFMFHNDRRLELILTWRVGPRSAPTGLAVYTYDDYPTTGDVTAASVLTHEGDCEPSSQPMAQQDGYRPLVVLEENLYFTYRPPYTLEIQ